MRKKPVQQRSRQMVDRLIEATGTVIAREGLDQATTNRIAEVAGVNIASLYQYFHDKSELVEALLDKANADIILSLNDQLGRVDLKKMDIRAVLKVTAVTGLAFLRSSPLHLELISNWHRLPLHRMLDPLEQYFLAFSRQFFLQRYEEYPMENIQAKLFVLINSAIFTTIRYLNQNDLFLKEEEVVDALVETIALSLEAGGKGPRTGIAPP